jgi:hypothetical protein
VGPVGSIQIGFLNQENSSDVIICGYFRGNIWKTCGNLKKC